MKYFFYSVIVICITAIIIACLVTGNADIVSTAVLGIFAYFLVKNIFGD